MAEPKLVHRVAATTATATLIVSALLLAAYFGKILLLVFAGILLGVLLQTLTDGLSRRMRLHRSFAYAVIAVLFLAALLALLWRFGPLAVESVNQLLDNLSRAVETVIAQLRGSPWGDRLLSGGGDFSSIARPAFNTVAGLLTAAGWAGTAILIVLFTGLYLAVEPTVYIDNLVRLFPPDRRQEARNLMEELGSTLRWWLLGRFSSMAVVGVLTWLGLLLLGLPLALTLALLAALLSFIPNIGPVLSAVPAVLIGFDQSATMALYVVVLYIAVQTVESYFITPLIQREAVQMPPALLITAQILLAFAYGPIGLLVATPLTAGGIVLIRRLYLSRYEE